MKSRTWMWMTVVYLVATLAMPVWTAAQDNQALKDNHQKYTTQQGRGPYTGTVWPGPQNSANAVDRSINDGGRDVRYTVTGSGWCRANKARFCQTQDQSTIMGPSPAIPITVPLVVRRTFC